MQANPNHWFWLAVSILVVWRVTTLICYEAGPFNLMTKLRRILYRIRLGSLIDCFHCTALWISIFVNFGLYKFSIAIVFLILAAAGGASIVERSLSYLSTLNQETNNE